MTVFKHKDDDRFYTIFDDKIYTVFLEDPEQPISLLTSKKGVKFFNAKLEARRNDRGFFFIALSDKKHRNN